MKTWTFSWNSTIVPQNSTIVLCYTRKMIAWKHENHHITLGRLQSVLQTNNNLQYYNTTRVCVCVCDRWALISFWWRWISSVVVGWWAHWWCRRFFTAFKWTSFLVFNQPLQEPHVQRGRKINTQRRDQLDASEAGRYGSLVCACVCQLRKSLVRFPPSAVGTC